MPELRGAGPIALPQPAVVGGKEPCGCRVWVRRPEGLLATLVGVTCSVTAGRRCHDAVMMQTLFFCSPPQVSGADPECSCDEGDETSRKKRSRNL